MQGIVTKSTGSWYTVRVDDETVIDCRIKGKFRLSGIKSTNPVTVGDVVNFEMEADNENGIITKIHDRKNYIIRKSVNLSKQTHIIAANIDQVFLLVTLKNPPTFTTFIDRFLATAEAYSIPSVILFNKIDLYSKELLAKKQELEKTYRTIGYECLDVSATEKINIDKLKLFMKDKVSMFSGHSGVGKSTLINAVYPELALKTAEISTQHKQGQHTTTFAEMFVLPFGGYIIDTPGIKGFGVVDFEKYEIGDYFPEFFALKQDCKFNNCLHVNEPDCAIKKAVENDEIAQSRYISYLQLIEGENENYRVDDWG
ncbi:ribosome small subunit-dependent GTPase A [Aureibaculum sp. 2210JD6-5]|uniref:ribosome small subunit-dependent GTPase A n=1 Tax=Aureibaculum sp. 2210JD6-5 TaxID=3103957 RepID=UPI002AACD215|nr:ribosome small subunit-dependent GTPase A [Aureibaculum sp. 2210JD6-5]MDY7395766.1 ribosome small subunit-dependent GTPase A [Aureibaculum sp. 2210JD6-5]